MTGGHSALPAAIIFLIVLAFACLWLCITQGLASLSGWNDLQRIYPDRDDIPRSRFRMQSATMKASGRIRVNFNGCLAIDACSSGLRFRLWKIFGLFQEPFLVPWRDIAAEPYKILFFTMARVRFAGWPEGELMMAVSRWNRIAAEAPQGGLVISA